MTTQPTNHRDEAGIQLAVARDDSESDPIGLGILHGILALHDLIAGLSDELDSEEQHQSEKFEAGWHGHPEPPEPQEIGAGYVATPLHHDPELDEDTPGTLDDDTVESPRFHGIEYIDDNRLGYPPSEEPADRVKVPGIGRTDFYGKPGPWDAA